MLQVAGLALADRFYACQCLQLLLLHLPRIFCHIIVIMMMVIIIDTPGVAAKLDAEVCK